MQSIIEQITEWLKEILVGGIINQLTGIFNSVNQQVSQISGTIGMTPEEYSPGIFSLIQSVSETVIMPIAGMILTFIACYELIILVTEHNNMANIDGWIFFKWFLKTYIGVLIVSNTFDITMGILDMARYIIGESEGLIMQQTAVNIEEILVMEGRLMEKEIGELLMLFLQTFVIQITTRIMSIAIFVIVHSRMIEIYLSTSLAPIPLSTLTNKEQSSIGQNYIRSLIALGVQGFLIMICIGIYAVLIQSITYSEDVITTVWSILGYTVLLVFALLRTGNLAKSILSVH